MDGSYSAGQLSGLGDLYIAQTRGIAVNPASTTNMTGVKKPVSTRAITIKYCNEIIPNTVYRASFSPKMTGMV